MAKHYSELLATPRERAINDIQQYMEYLAQLQNSRERNITILTDKIRQAWKWGLISEAEAERWKMEAKQIMGDQIPCVTS